MKIVSNLENDFHPYPKQARIKNKKLLQDKKGICQQCGKKGYTEKHHIKTKGSGGDDIEENLIEVCRVCHRLIHDGKIKPEKKY